MTIHAAEAGTVALRVKYSTDKTGNIVFSNAANGESASVVTTSVHPAWAKSEATLHLAQGDNLITINFDQEWVAMDYVAVSELTPDEPSLEPGFTVFQEPADVNSVLDGEITLVNNNIVKTEQDGSTGPGCFEIGIGDRKGQIYYYAPKNGTAKVRVRYLADKERNITVENKTNKASAVRQSANVNPNWDVLEFELKVQKGSNTILLSTDSDWIIIDYIAVSNMVTQGPEDLEPGIQCASG